MFLTIDTSTNIVSIQKSYLPPTLLTSDSRGSNQLLPEGTVLAGWGSNPWISEYEYVAMLACDFREYEAVMRA
jgi:hypothetical protein